MDFWQTVFAAGLGAFIATMGKSWLTHIVGVAKLDESLRDYDVGLAKKIIFETRDLAVEYWQLEADDEKLPVIDAAVDGRLTFLGQLLERLFAAETLLLRRINLQLNKFHDAVTDGNFGVSGRTAEPNRAKRIEIESFKLAHETVVCRRKMPRKFFRIF